MKVLVKESSKLAFSVIKLIGAIVLLIFAVRALFSTSVG